MVVAGLVVYILLVPLSLGYADRYFKSELACIRPSFFFPSLCFTWVWHMFIDPSCSMCFQASNFGIGTNRSHFVKKMTEIPFVGISSSLVLWIAASFHRPFFHVRIQIHFWIMIGGWLLVSSWSNLTNRAGYYQPPCMMWIEAMPTISSQWSQNLWYSVESMAVRCKIKKLFLFF